MVVKTASETSVKYVHDYVSVVLTGVEVNPTPEEIVWADRSATLLDIPTDELWPSQTMWVYIFSVIDTETGEVTTFTRRMLNPMRDKDLVMEFIKKALGARSKDENTDLDAGLVRIWIELMNGTVVEQ